MKDIKIIQGFGIKHWGVAIYIDDILFNEKDYCSEMFEDESILMQLVNKMANEFSISIQHITAHIAYHLTSYYINVPTTYAQYEKGILDYYSDYQTFESIEEHLSIWTPRDLDDEKRIIKKAFELNGGVGFEEFYTQYLTLCGSIFDSQEWTQYSIVINNPNKKDSQKRQVYYNNLQQAILEKLKYTWNAPKNFEPYKLQWLNKKLLS